MLKEILIERDAPDRSNYWTCCTFLRDGTLSAMKPCRTQAEGTFVAQEFLHEFYPHIPLPTFGTLFQDCRQHLSGLTTRIYVDVESPRKDLGYHRAERYPKYDANTWFIIHGYFPRKKVDLLSLITL